MMFLKCQVKLTLFRQDGPVSHWLVSKGALHKLRLHNKKLKIKLNQQVAVGKNEFFRLE